jgi:endonuclease YncB( thermonuclease family)
VLRHAAAAALLLVALAGQAQAARPAPQWTGRVTFVSDGDSLWVQPAGVGAKPVEIRLVDIDAPEICQAWGKQARDALKRLVTGKSVAVQTVTRDRYGRTLARITVNGQSVSAWLVQQGHAWSQRSRWEGGPLVTQEQQAKTLRRGLHSQPAAIQPRDFRRSHGPCVRPAAAPGRAK